MKVYVDASAIVAMIAKEPEATSFAEYLGSYDERITGATSGWEAARGVEGARGITFEEARLLVREFLVGAKLKVVPIGHEEADIALDAHQRFGKGINRAKLNLGDRFSYACAKAYGAEIMFKGEDFIHTDLRDAMLP